MTASLRLPPPPKHLSRAEDMPDCWRVYAECPDEVTTLLVGNPSVISLDMGDTETQGQLVRCALTEHLERCAACRRWGLDA